MLLATTSSSWRPRPNAGRPLSRPRPSRRRRANHLALAERRPSHRRSHGRPRTRGPVADPVRHRHRLPVPARRADRRSVLTNIRDDRGWLARRRTVPPEGMRPPIRPVRLERPQCRRRRARPADAVASDRGRDPTPARPHPDLGQRRRPALHAPHRHRDRISSPSPTPSQTSAPAIAIAPWGRIERQGVPDELGRQQSCTKAASAPSARRATTRPNS